MRKYRKDATPEELAHDVLKRVWSRTDSSAPDECWVWLPPIDKEGTPKIYNGINCKVQTVKRALAHANNVLYKTPMPSPKLRPVMTCRDLVCVNPAHTKWSPRSAFMKYVAEVTGYPQSETRRIKLSDARRRVVGKLTDEQVADVIADPRSNKELAAIYGCTPETIRNHRKRNLPSARKNNPWAALLSRS